MKRKIFRSLAIACSLAMLVQTFPMVTLAQTEPTIPATVTESGSKTLLPIGSDTNEKIATDITANEAEESPIVGEDTTRRTSNEKHFRKADGSFVQISYDEPIHYEKDGKWEEIDNTLIEKQRTDGSKYLTNKASDVDVELPTHFIMLNCTNKLLVRSPRYIMLGQSQALKGFRSTPEKSRGITIAMLAGIHHLFR